MYNCLNCSEKLKVKLLDMGKVPIANHLLYNKTDTTKLYPLKVYLCKKCKLYQIGKKISPKKIFNNYFYHSSYSSSFLRHAENFVNDVVKEIDFTKNNLIFEIA